MVGIYMQCPKVAVHINILLLAIDWSCWYLYVISLKFCFWQAVLSIDPSKKFHIVSKESEFFESYATHNI